VYPFVGLEPTDWIDWAQSANREGLAELLNQLEPQGPPHWLDFVNQQTPQIISEPFLTRIAALSPAGVGLFIRQLPAKAYRALFRLNDRQGELFVYMHSDAGTP
jgi:hypothetical protein